MQRAQKNHQLIFQSLNNYFNMKKTFIKIVLFFLVVTIVVFFLIKSDYNKTVYQDNLKLPTENYEFEISAGDSSKIVAKKLLENGVFTKKTYYYFLYYLRNNDLANKIQAGKYILTTDKKISDLLILFQKAEEDQVKVRITEGTRKDEIAQELSLKLKENFDKDEFLTLTIDKNFISELQLNLEDSDKILDLEGFLYPDTYLFPKDADAKYVIKKLIDNYSKKINSLDYSEKITYSDIIIASLVEREGLNSEDKPLIAGIIKKRLEKSWFLNIDATLLYNKKDWKYELTTKDLQTDQPYNTYTRLGLPPTPICNPTINSISSVLFDKDSEYYYYIHDNKGNAYFAKTLFEHQSNIDKYLKND